MARITVEDCLNKVDNRFKLIHLAAKRVRQLRKGAEPLVKAKNTDVVCSLREIASGEVFPIDDAEQSLLLTEDFEPLNKLLPTEASTENAAPEETTVDKDATPEEKAH